MLEQGATRVWNAEQQVPYLVQGDTWLGYDDAESIIAKVTTFSRILFHKIYERKLIYSSYKCNKN